jgi:DNA-binding PadR family transcriptional regulator
MGDEIRLKTAWLYILLSLAGEDRHGLGIARDVGEMSEGRVHLWPATLYGSLEALRDRGWIEELDDRDDLPDVASQRRRYYRITRSGLTVLSQETGRLSRLTRIASARVRLRSSEAR